MNLAIPVRTFFLLTTLAAVAVPASAQSLMIQEDNYPRVFYFRATERACSPGAYPTYESWERDFDGLMGIMGKCLEEECLGRLPRAPEFFSRFKQRHPEQAVLLHFNGNSRDPLFEAEDFFPGHWIYRKAVTITEDVPAEAGQSVIHVSDASGFRVNAGRYRTSNDDIALFGIRDGRHDWYHCEQVQLVSVDVPGKKITVKRGCYGTRPLAFAKDESRAAAHQVEGPWGATNHLLWFYNYSTHCPKDRQGRTCSDLIVDDLARWFADGGVLEAYDGLEFDVLFNVTHGDTDGDGEEDNGIVEGINNYGIGVVEFGRKLRERMGEDFVIQADGALGPGGVRSQRCFQIFNGIESEGWPNLHDWDMEDWSGGLNRHRFWQRNARPPAFNYINHKWNQSIPGRPGHHRPADVPMARHRLSFAAGQFTDAMICYSSSPQAPRTTGATYWHRDVAVPSDARLQFSIGMGEKSPELSDGVLFRVLAAKVQTEGVGDYQTLFETTSNQFEWLPQTVSLASYAGETIRLKFVADCGPADNATTDHAFWGDVRVVSDQGVQELVTRKLPATGMRPHYGEDQPLDRTSGARVGYDAEAEIGGKSLPAYAVHPPYRGEQKRFDKYPIWDEFIAGEANELGWLGSPEGPAVHLAESTPDLLDGKGHGTALAERITGPVVVATSPHGVKVRPTDPEADELKFTIRDIPADGPHLFVSMAMVGEPMPGYPREMARFAQVAASGGMVDLLAGTLDETGMCLRGGEEEPIERASGAYVQNHRGTAAGVELPAVRVHPPYRGGSGYSYWIREATVPEDSELRFSLGMGELSPERSDGVWFKVYVAKCDGNAVGPYEKIFEESTNKYEWLPRRVSLVDYAGERVRLKFVADCGPKNNTVTDQGQWGDVKIIARGADESEVTRSVPYMTWVNDRPFTSHFYYRHINTDRVDVTVSVESAAPVVISAIRVHAHPDAMVRQFERGLVLANPARVPYMFDLDTLAPGRSYRRLQGTPLQDPATNNGRPVSGKVTLGPRDALFLRQTAP